MPKAADVSVYDAALDKIATATTMTVCSTEPTTRTEAVTTYKLATTSMVGGDYTKANGDVSGRKVTMAQKSGVSVDSSGTANWVCLCDSTTLLYKTTCTAQSLTAGNTVTFPTWKVEIQAPT